MCQVDVPECTVTLNERSITMSIVTIQENPYLRCNEAINHDTLAKFLQCNREESVANIVHDTFGNFVDLPFKKRSVNKHLPINQFVFIDSLYSHKKANDDMIKIFKNADALILQYDLAEYRLQDVWKFYKIFKNKFDLVAVVIIDSSQFWIIITEGRLQQALSNRYMSLQEKKETIFEYTSKNSPKKVEVQSNEPKSVVYKSKGNKLPISHTSYDPKDLHKYMRFIAQDQNVLCCYSLDSKQLTFYNKSTIPATKTTVQLDAAPDKIICVEQIGSNRLFIFSENRIESTDHTGKIYEYKNKIGSGHYIIAKEDDSSGLILLKEITDEFIACSRMQVSAIKGSVQEMSIKPVANSLWERCTDVAKAPVSRARTQPVSKPTDSEQAPSSRPSQAFLSLDKLITKDEIIKLQQVYLIEFYQRLNKCLANNRAMTIELNKSKLHRSTLTVIVNILESDPRYAYVQVDTSRDGFVKLSYRS